MRSLLLLSLLLSATQAFSPDSQGRTAATTHSMAPRFVGGEWVANSPDERPEAGYGPGKTLLMHGPKPFFSRIFQEREYEQAVLKFMAQDGVSRIEAQGNMDAYLRNPNDWAYQRFESQRKGVKVNYWDIKPKELGLVFVWSTVVLSVVGRGAYAISEGVGFYDFLE